MCEKCHLDAALFHARSQQALHVLASWKDRGQGDWMPLWKMHRRMPWRVQELQDVLEALLSQRLIAYKGIRSAGRADDFYRLSCSPEEIRAHDAARRGVERRRPALAGESLARRRHGGARQCVVGLMTIAWVLTPCTQEVMAGESATLQGRVCFVC